MATKHQIRQTVQFTEYKAIPKEEPLFDMINYLTIFPFN